MPDHIIEFHMSPENDEMLKERQDEEMKAVDQESAQMMDKLDNSFVPALLADESKDFTVSNPQL